MDEKTQEPINNRPWLFQKGNRANPGGRPKGSKSMKTWVKEYLATLTEAERIEYLDGMNKVDIWKMGEGNPESSTDITSGGQTIPVLVQFVDGNKTTDNKNTDRV